MATSRGGTLAGFAPAVSQGWRMPGFDALDAQRKATTANPLTTNWSIDQPVMSSGSMPKPQPLIDPSMLSAFINQEQGGRVNSGAETPSDGMIRTVTGNLRPYMVLAMGGRPAGRAMWEGEGGWADQARDMGFKFLTGNEWQLPGQGVEFSSIANKLARAMGLQGSGGMVTGAFNPGFINMMHALGWSQYNRGLDRGNRWSGPGGLESFAEQQGWTQSQRPEGTFWTPRGGAFDLRQLFPGLV